MLKKLVSIVLVLALAVAFAACGEKETPPATTPTPGAPAAPTPTPEEPGMELKIAMLLPGVINDGGWNTMAYTALKEAETTFNAKIAYTELVTQNDQVKIARQYVAEGYNVIIGHGYEFGDALTEVAAEYPDVYFINYGGDVKNGKNLASVQYAYGETGALLGVLVGKSEGITKVGLISAFDNPTGRQEMKNIEITAQKYNPDIEFVYSYTGNWDDIGKAKEAATALLAQGCQVIGTDLSGPIDAIIQAVKEKDAKFMAITLDGYEKGPENCLGSAVHDATKATLAALQHIVDGDFEGTVYAFGIKDGVMFLGTYGPSVTEEMKAEVEKIKAEIVAGTYKLEIFVES